MARVRREVRSARDDGYDAARVIHNAMISKRPALIVRCTGVADVIDAVNSGREPSTACCSPSGARDTSAAVGDPLAACNVQMLTRRP